MKGLRWGGAGALVVLVLAATLAPQASAHAGGAWLYPATVQNVLRSAGYNLPACSGRGEPRYTSRSTMNPATWLFRHFECAAMDGGGYPKWTICVHSLTSGRIFVSRRSLISDGFFPCRF